MIRHVIVDFHTHVFPPEVAVDRDLFLQDDATFAALYGSEKARLASADELLTSMDAAQIDVSVALGFAWKDIETCQRHNDYLLEASSRHPERLLAFCILPLASGPEAIVREGERCRAAGARGFGELRPQSVGVKLNESGLAEALVAAAAGLPLLFHVSEPVGHAYPGKSGLEMDSYYDFLVAHPEALSIGAHWAGGLPFYALMPEVRLALAQSYVDTAGTSLLYDESIYGNTAANLGPERILFGSDFPLLSQSRSRRRIEQAALDKDVVSAILGDNAARLLALE